MEKLALVLSLALRLQSFTRNNFRRNYKWDPGHNHKETCWKINLDKHVTKMFSTQICYLLAAILEFFSFLILLGNLSGKMFCKIKGNREVYKRVLTATCLHRKCRCHLDANLWQKVHIAELFDSQYHDQNSQWTRFECHHECSYQSVK